MTKHKKRPRHAKLVESRAAEVLTIGWMLMVVTVFVCETGFLVTRFQALQSWGTMVDVLGKMLLFAAFVIGFLLLLLTPVVIKSRRQPPPPPITVAAVIVGLAPWAMMLTQLLH